MSPADRRSSRLVFTVLAVPFAVCASTLSRAASAAGYSISVFQGSTYKGFHLGQTGDGIGPNGEVVGEAAFDFTQNGVLRGDEHGVLEQNGQLVDLGDLDGDANVVTGDGSRAVAINGSGLIVGWSYAYVGADPVMRPVAWQNGKIRDLGVFPAATTGFFDVEATNVNSVGQIVGFANSNGSLGAVAWTIDNGVPANLPTLGGKSAEAWGINGAGIIVGAADIAGGAATHAAVWRNGVAHDLGTLAGGLFSEAVSINQTGTAVGVSTLAETESGYTLDFGDRHAVIFSGGKVQDLTSDLMFGQDAFAAAINDAGQIVGAKNGRAFLWQNGTGTDLNTLIPAGSNVRLLAANGINVKGQIAGTGQLISGGQIAFLLTPH